MNPREITPESEESKKEIFPDYKKPEILMGKYDFQKNEKPKPKREIEYSIEGGPKPYAVGLLDPRPAEFEKVKNYLQGIKAFGIEVTIKKLADLCEYGNLDPQHSGGDSNRAAIEDAVSIELPQPDAVLVTIRPDLDALGSMAIFNIRKHTDLGSEILEKVKKIAEMDTFSKGGWPGEKELPTKENPWPEGQSELAPLNALASDFNVPVAGRVMKIQQWLVENIIPTEYVEKLNKERKEIAASLEVGQIKIDVKYGIATVETTHRAGMDMGYRKAPIVIALNPKFQFQGGEPHTKYTIAQFTNTYVDLVAVKNELNTKEKALMSGEEKVAEWGGSPTIIGSPQGVSSKLSMDEVFEIVRKYIK